jgi:hypothetical protein
MKKLFLWGLAGVVIGFILRATLAGYPVFSTAYTQGQKL